MKIIITSLRLDLTPSLQTYAENKLSPLSRLVKHFDAQGSVELRFEVERSTRHHRHGEVFFAAADMRLPKKILRAEAEAEDVHAAIDMVKNTLHLEIEKYRTKFLKSRRGGRGGK